MGKIIKLEGRILIPTQSKICKTNTLKKTFWMCYYDKIKEIPIFPVKENPENKNNFLILDGHHRAIIYDLFGIENFNLWLSEHKEDYMEINNINEEIIKSMNNNINKRWEYVTSKKREKECHKNFERLRIKYNFLKNVDTAKKYFS